MTTPSRITRITWEMDQDPALADALRQRILGQEFTEAIQAMQASNTEMMTRQAQLGETVRSAMQAVTASVQEMVRAVRQMHSDIGQLDDRGKSTKLQTQERQEKRKNSWAPSRERWTPPQGPDAR